MHKLKDIPDYKDCEFVKGLRVGNISIKVYESKEKKYLIVRLRYVLGIPVSKNEMLVDDYEQADDLIRDLKFDGQCEKSRII